MEMVLLVTSILGALAYIEKLKSSMRRQLARQDVQGNSADGYIRAQNAKNTALLSTNKLKRTSYG